MSCCLRGELPVSDASKSVVYKRSLSANKSWSPRVLALEHCLPVLRALGCRSLLDALRNRSVLLVSYTSAVVSSTRGDGTYDLSCLV